MNIPILKSDTHRVLFGDKLTKLPDSVCDKSSFVSDIQYGNYIIQSTIHLNINHLVDVDAECWNGISVSPYIHPTPQFTLEEQKCNPEVVPEELSCDTKSLIWSLLLMVLVHLPFSSFDSPGYARQINGLL